MSPVVDPSASVLVLGTTALVFPRVFEVFAMGALRSVRVAFLLDTGKSNAKEAEKGVFPVLDT